ncbi:PREDICTED: prolyl endopeptidase-like [Priapulus caudatus]|uniref:Prolyl endopeptidase n=1 Tax=Priapulus caudatus TaxID=37621 RepID=A0ABM1DQ77_PRICU|nr:PREDICTED: prolyl endopeptidase-like [Priapulus caudatus]
MTPQLDFCTVSDSYRWLEDPDSEETKAFVDAQNEIAIPYLEKCKNRQDLQKRLKELWNYPKYSCPFRRGHRYFYYLNTGLQNQSVLYVQESMNAEAEVFLDANTLSHDGTVSLRGTAFSEDGRYFAYGLSESGSDWVKIKFMDVENRKELPDTLHYVKFSSMAWTHDNKGLFYNRYPKLDNKGDGTETDSNVNQQLYYHRIGTEQEADPLCMEWPSEPKWMTGAEVSHCGRYVVVTVRRGCDPVNMLYYTDLQGLTDGITGMLPLVTVVDNFDAEYEYITNEGTVCTFKTNLKSPNYKLINIDFNNLGMDNWVDLIPEHSNDVLEWATCVNGNVLVLCYIEDVKNAVYLHDLETGKQLKKLPLDVGAVTGYSGKKDHNEMFYYFTSFLTPGTIFHYDFSETNPVPKVFREIETQGFDAHQYETKQVFFPSKDGTKIPMFIVHRKGIVLDGSHPVLMYGYGGFNIALLPYFSVSRIVFMQNLSGVFALVNLRGGGEYGETWHQGGMLGNKQNVFDDFHAAAEHLVEQKYTTPSRLTIMGGSNGGLLVGACANQRPELYGVVIAQVGVMDMLRFHKFTIGHAWTSDFGSSEIEEQFKWQIKYSPLHNIAVPKDGIQYPAMLLLSGDHDDRVVPLHSLKYIAEVQKVVGKVPKQTNPLLIRVDTKSGHGGGKPTAKTIEEMAEIYAFISENLQLQWHE